MEPIFSVNGIAEIVLLIHEIIQVRDFFKDRE